MIPPLRYPGLAYTVAVVAGGHAGGAQGSAGGFGKGMYARLPSAARAECALALAPGETPADAHAALSRALRSAAPYGASVEVAPLAVGSGAAGYLSDPRGQ